MTLFVLPVYVLRIVRLIAQYFYPQRQTKLMNEGCATFVHYHIVNEMYDRGLISEGALLEILHSHSNVVYQTDFDHPHHSGLNPYALGFAMMQDIQRICAEPTAEVRAQSLQPEDVAATVLFALSLPERACVAELTVLPTALQVLGRT